MKVSYDGNFIKRIEDGAVMDVIGSSLRGWLNEGVELTLRPGPINDKKRSEHLKASNYSQRFVINEDGTVSTARCSNLVLGLSYFPKLYLVDRMSPNRAVFKNVDALHQSRNSPGYSDAEGIKLELISHPTYAIAPTSARIVIRFGSGFIKLGLGSEENALRVVYRINKFIIQSCNNSYLSHKLPASFAGNQIIAIGGDKPNFSESLFTKFVLMNFIWGKWTEFSLNGDGTISPLNAPHLALGFQVPNFSNQRREPILGHTYDPLHNNTTVSNSVASFVSMIVVKILCKENSFFQK